MRVEAESYGALGDGKTDDTPSIQAALSSVGVAGGGSVVLRSLRYFTEGTLEVPPGVVLCGETEGPFDVAMDTAPTLLVTSGHGTASGAFLNLSGASSGVTDVLFHYPNQAPPQAPAPVSYPWTIMLSAPGTKVKRCSFTNAYRGISVVSGRAILCDLSLGALYVGILIDSVQDRVSISRVVQSVFWDVVAHLPWPQPIDTQFVQNQAYGFIVRRCDSLSVQDVLVFSRYAGFFFGDSSDPTQSPPCGYGGGSQIDLDTVRYGMIVQSSNSPGYKFSNVDFGGVANAGNAAVYFQPGGSMPPKVSIHGGSLRGGWQNPWAQNGVAGSVLKVENLV